MNCEAGLRNKLWRVQWIDTVTHTNAILGCVLLNAFPAIPPCSPWMHAKSCFPLKEPSLPVYILRAKSTHHIAMLHFHFRALACNRSRHISTFLHGVRSACQGSGSSQGEGPLFLTVFTKCPGAEFLSKKKPQLLSVSLVRTASVEGGSGGSHQDVSVPNDLMKF